MRVILQRVQNANVTVSDTIVGSIGQGLVVLVGFTHDDNKTDLEWMCRKLLHLRIFNDEQGKMNLSIADVKGEFLVVSQFTLYASTKKGNRPSYIRAARPDHAERQYQEFVDILGSNGRKIETGIFGAMMKVSLVNDGPVTIHIDSQQKE